LVCSSGAALLCPGPMCLLMTWNSKEGIVAPTYCAGKSERSAAFSATAGTHKPRGPPGCPSSTGNLFENAEIGICTPLEMHKTEAFPVKWWASFTLTRYIDNPVGFHRREID
jgi:hypothetical protein